MSANETNREAAVALAQALGNLPLALEQAAAYTAQTGLSLADYLSLFREHAAAYTPPASPSADYPDALAITFEIAFERLREDSPAATDLLTLCAFLAPDDVPLEIFKEAASKTGADAMPPKAPASDAATLQTYALAKVRGGSFLSMHRLIQAIARDRLDDDERRKWTERAVMLMRAAFTFNIDDTRTWPPSARLLQHALTAAEHAKAFGVASETASFLLNNVGAYLMNKAELVEAKAAFEKSSELSERLFGLAHPHFAVRLSNIGETLRMQGNLDEAAEYLKRALAIDEAALGPDHPSVAIDLNNIGNVLYEKGNYAEARKQYERALAIDEAALGPDHPNVAIRLNNIGIALYSEGDLKSAYVCYERALPIYEKVYGPDHPNVAIALSNLALTDLDNVGLIRQHLERALRISLKHLSEKHPLTLTLRRQLAELDERARGSSSSEEATVEAAEVKTSEDADATE